jgi:hypothetical protein
MHQAACLDAGDLDIVTVRHDVADHQQHIAVATL